MSHISADLSHSVNHLVSYAEPILARFGYPGIFVANFADGVGIPLPGQTLLMVGALMAAHGHFNIALVVLLALLASTLGACLGYWIGRNGGRVLLQKARVSPRRLQRVEDFFSRYGSFLVLLSRFVDGFRQLTPIVAGSMGMSWWRFFVATFVGSVLWVSVWGVGVYLLGRDFHEILTGLRHFAPYQWLASGVAVVSLIGWLVYRQRAD
jgi:membrane protein DedA with SNARE-associated domain